MNLEAFISHLFSSCFQYSIWKEDILITNVTPNILSKDWMFWKKSFDTSRKCEKESSNTWKTFTAQPWSFTWNLQQCEELSLTLETWSFQQLEDVENTPQPSKLKLSTNRRTFMHTLFRTSKSKFSTIWITTYFQFQTWKQARNERLKVHEMEQLYQLTKRLQVVCFEC